MILAFSLLELFVAIVIIVVIVTIVIPMAMQVRKNSQAVAAKAALLAAAATPKVFVSSGATTIITITIPKVIFIDNNGNSTTSGTLLVIQRPATAGAGRTINFQVIPHTAPIRGTVTINPTSGSTGTTTGVISFTFNTTNYEGYVTIIGIDTVSNEAGVATVNVRSRP